MFSTKKIAAAAGVLGSLALIGLGAGQAVATDTPGNKCVDDGKGTIRCVQVAEYRMKTDSFGKVHLVNESEQSCPSTKSEVACSSDVVVRSKES
ncbi:hypothetical protein N4P33_29315 [Streptomyces sp. 15-116A]|uniref:hypothetical protein n=1 Tax=Streptomyces sp. 15-116A TaxID=2259035 RepID=UPI0021B25CF3|nr:hypothetical protein [Streptomyces sp. 15-116A]MCT7356216.1 hypothetical protein [Streptomyces sp. 15-116A]